MKKNYLFLLFFLLDTQFGFLQAADEPHPLKKFLAELSVIAAMDDASAQKEWINLLSTSQPLYSELAKEPDLYVHIKQCNWGMVAPTRADWMKLVNGSVENLKKLFLPKDVCAFTSIFNPLLNSVGEFALQKVMELFSKKKKEEIKSLLDNEATKAAHKTILSNLKEGLINLKLAELPDVQKVILGIKNAPAPLEIKEAMPLSDWITDYLNHMSLAQKANLVHDFILLPDKAKEGQQVAVLMDNCGPILFKIFNYLAQGDLYVDSNTFKLFNGALPFLSKQYQNEDSEILNLKNELGLEKIHWETPYKGSTALVFSAESLQPNKKTENVVIKVLQKDIRFKLTQEYEHLQKIAFPEGFKNLLAIVYDELMAETDLLQEGKNLLEAQKIFAEKPNITVPQVIKSTKEVLVMSVAKGTAMEQKEAESLKELKNRYDKVVQINKHWFESTFFSKQDYLVHGDLHAGNIFLADHLITLIDWAGSRNIKADDRKALLYFFVATGVKNYKIMARSIVQDPDKQKHAIKKMAEEFKHIFESNLKEEEQFTLLFLKAFAYKNTRFKQWFPILRSFIFLQSEMDRLAVQINKDAKEPVLRSSEWLAHKIGRAILQQGLPTWILSSDKDKLFSARELFMSLTKILMSKGFQMCLDLRFWTKFEASQF